MVREGCDIQARDGSKHLISFRGGSVNIVILF